MLQIELGKEVYSFPESQREITLEQFFRFLEYQEIWKPLSLKKADALHDEKLVAFIGQLPLDEIIDKWVPWWIAEVKFWGNIPDDVIPKGGQGDISHLPIDSIIQFRNLLIRQNFETFGKVSDFLFFNHNERKFKVEFEMDKLHVGGKQGIDVVRNRIIPTLEEFTSLISQCCHSNKEYYPPKHFNNLPLDIAFNVVLSIDDLVYTAKSYMGKLIYEYVLNLK